MPSRSRSPKHSALDPTATDEDLDKYYLPLIHATLDVLLVAGFNLISLEEGYDKYALPSQDSVTEVKLILDVFRVVNIDEENSEISLDIIIRLYWKEPRILIGNATKKAIPLSPEYLDKIWSPDLNLIQLAKAEKYSLSLPLISLKVFTKSKKLRYKFMLTVTVSCDMDFQSYPRDVQRCSMDFTSYVYPNTSVQFSWREKPLMFRSGNVKEVGLPNYEIHFTPDYEFKYITDHDASYSALRIKFSFNRHLMSHLMHTYFPSSLFVFVSWISFLVPYSSPPGRFMVLITSLLSLITLLEFIRESSPSSLHIKNNELWVLTCLIFVAAALLEYAVLLHAMRRFSTTKKTFTTPRRSSFFIGLKPLGKAMEEVDVMLCIKFFKKIWVIPLDLIAVIMFPVLFIIFCCSYWIFIA